MCIRDSAQGEGAHGVVRAEHHGLVDVLNGGNAGLDPVSYTHLLGLAEGAINEAVKYTKERVQFGRRLSQFQNTQFQLCLLYTSRCV